MRLCKLNLRNFRNYENLELTMDPGVNLIVGNNAQGKTNLLEAISYLGSGKSFRAQKTSEMVRFSADFADLEGEIFSQERNQTLRWVLFNGSRPRQIYRNGAKKKSASDISGVLQTVLFCPEDLMVLKTGASARRRLGDHALCQLRPNYEAALTEYNRILDQKSRILKDHFENPAVLAVLEAADTSDNTHNKLVSKCTYYQIPLYRLTADTARLAHAVGKTGAVAAVGVTDENFCKALAAHLPPRETADDGATPSLNE